VKDTYSTSSSLDLTVLSQTSTSSLRRYLIIRSSQLASTFDLITVVPPASLDGVNGATSTVTSSPTTSVNRNCCAVHRIRILERCSLLVRVHFVGAHARLQSRSQRHDRVLLQTVQFPLTRANCVERSSIAVGCSSTLVSSRGCTL